MRIARRSAIVVFLASVGLAVAAGFLWWRQPAAFALPPPGADRDILLVTIDTLRADALGAYGGRAATPHLDALAAAGARFTFAHAHSVLTLPSHATILTGRYPTEHGVRDNQGYRLAPSQPTLASRLKARGFATGAFVGAFPVERRFGLATGFDVYDDRVGEVGSTANFSQTERRADEVVRVAAAWIDRQTAPWFAWVHVFDPHAPYRAPDEWRARYPNDPYFAEVAWTDAALGALFDRLAARSRPTLVVVTADHGEGLGDHGELTHGVFAYEATLRVPLIIASIDPGASIDPAHRAAGRGVVIDTPARHIDILPTLLDVAAAPSDTSLPGASLRDVVAEGRGPDRPAYFEALMTNLARGWAPLHGVITDREKYIDLPIAELYDLTADPGEARNLTGARPDRVGVLQRLVAGWSQGPVARPVEEPAAVKDRLRSLGYTGISATPQRDRYTEADDPKRLIQLDRQMHEAVVAHEAGRFDEAVALLERVIAQRPDNAEAYLDLAAVFWRTDRTAEAIAVLQRAVAKGLPQPELRAKLGLSLALSGDARRAIPLLEATAGDDVELLNGLGVAYGQAGRRADATRTLERALAIDPASGLAHENLAALLIDAKDFRGAEAALRRALDIDPSLTGARTQLGGVLAITGRRDDAIAEWTRAVDLDPEAFEALYNATMALAEDKKLERARPLAERFLRDAPPAQYGPQLAMVRRLLGR